MIWYKDSEGNWKRRLCAGVLIAEAPKAVPAFKKIVPPKLPKAVR